MRSSRAQAHTLPMGGQGRRIDLSGPAAMATATTTATSISTPTPIDCTNQRLEKALNKQGKLLLNSRDCKVCQNDGKIAKTGQKCKALGELLINLVE